jgi:hypothetical protein
MIARPIMPRFTLLEHSGAPDDPTGRHYDLLVESGAICLTWRLAKVPCAVGEWVEAKPLAPHALRWLDVKNSDVSQGRGSVRRIDCGTCEIVLLPSVVVLEKLTGNAFAGRLRLQTVDPESPDGQWQACLLLED